jgi:hypothetical protein
MLLHLAQRGISPEMLLSMPLLVQSSYLLAWARACSSPLGAAFFCRLYPKWTRTCYV